MPLGAAEIPSCPRLGSGGLVGVVLADSFSVLGKFAVLLLCYCGAGAGEEEGCQDCSGARGEQPPVPGLGVAAPARLWKLPPRLHATAWNQIAEHGTACLPF